MMRLKRKNKTMLLGALMVIMFVLFNPSIEYQLSTIHKGDWETVEVIDGMEDLYTEEEIIIEGELISQRFDLAASVTDYPNSVQSQTYGSTVQGPPLGMGVNDATHSTLQEASYVSTSYTTKTSYIGGSVPSGWYASNIWIFSASWATATGITYTDGFFYTNSHDMDSYDGTRTKFSWKNDGNENTEAGEFKFWSYEQNTYHEVFASPAGNQGSWDAKTYDRAIPTLGDWKVRFNVYTLTGDVESWEGFSVDNIYLQGKVNNTYYRFEAVYKFDTVEYGYGTERLYADFDAATSTENIKFYGGITTNPSYYLGMTLGAGADIDFDISGALTGSPFYVEIQDNERNDGDQDSWLIDRLYIVVTTVDPVNDQEPVCTNLDDTDNLYARYKTYNFSTSVTDGDGATNINYVDLYCMNGAATVWQVRYTESSNGFSEISGGSYIQLTGSVYTKSGVNLDIWFGVKIEWIHPDAQDYDLKQYVVDDYAGSDTDTYSLIDYDYETRMDIANWDIDDYTGTSDRGNLDGTFYYWARPDYYASNLQPPSNEVDIWVSASEYGTNVGPWEDETISGTFFNVTCYADNVFGQDTYTPKIVAEGTGSGGTDLLYWYGPSWAEEYIADSLTITITGPTDNRQNINANATGIIVSAVYDYGGTFDGTLGLNNTDYNGDGSVVRWDYTVSSVSGGAHGVTTISSNDDTYMIWDQIEVYYGAVSDARTNVNEQEYPYFRLRLKYDNHLLNDGTNDGVYINSSSATWSAGLTSWYKYYTQSSVGIWNFVVTSASENTYGITALNSASAITYDKDIIWDRVRVVSYTIVSPSGDNRNNIGTTYTIDIELHYDYDETDVADGTITVNGEAMDSYQGSGKWRWTPYQAGVIGITYNNMQASGNTYLITVEDNTVTQLIIWDRVRVVSYTIITPSGDNRNNIGTTYTIDIELHYDYDETDVADGTITVNGESMDSYQGSGKWRWTPYQAGVIGITYNNMQATGNAHGITAEDNTVTQLIIWDRVRVVSYTIVNPSGDNRNNIGTTYTIDIELHYDYDETDVADGTITVNGESMDSYQGSGKWRWTPYQAGVTGITYNNMQATGNTHGITVEDNTITQLIIWDRVQVQSYTVTDDWVNINDNVNIDFLVWYDYDNTQVTNGDFTLNGYDATHQGSGVWRITRTSASPTLVTYNTVLVSATNAHGIDAEDQNSKSRQVVWDSVTISITGPTDNRQNIGANATGIIITITMDYNATAYGGTATMNNTDYNGDGSVVRWGYTVSSVNGGTEGITTISTNDETYMIWDRIKILTTSATINYIEYGTESTTINVTAELDYDSHALGSGDTLYMNDTSMIWDTDHFYIVFGPYSVFDTWFLFVNSSSANEATYGITTVWLNSQEDTVATDRVKVISYAISDARDNINDYIWTNVTVQYESDSTVITDGTIVINGYSFTHLGGGIWRHNRTQASAVNVTFDTVVASGNTRGIAVVNQNSQSQVAVWDSYTVAMTISDNRVNINVNITFGYTVISDYDGIDYDGTRNLNYTTYDHATAQRRGYTMLNLAGDDTYGITAIKTNDEDYAIWDSLTITIIDPTDQRVDLNVNATGISASAIRDYDSSAFDGTLTFNATDWDGDGTVVRWGWTISSASGGTYGITTINSNDETYEIWDRVAITLSANMTWQVITYYINVSYVSIYEYDSTAYSGTYTWNDAVGIITKSTVANYTWYPTAIADANYQLTGFSNNTEWCVWDDVIYGSEGTNHWSKDVGYSRLTWGAVSTWKWEFNNTWVDNTYTLHGYSNESTPEASGGIYGSGNFAGIVLGPYDISWYYLNLTVNCEVTIGGNSYDWEIYSDMLPVDILHSLQTNVWYLYREGNYYSLLMHSNYENASVMVWDDMETGTGNFNDSIYYGNYEGMHEWLRDTTVGTHNCTILINAGADKGAVERNYVDNDLRLWYNFTYAIDPAVLAIINPVYTASDEMNFLSGETNVGCDWYAYNNDTEMDSGTIGVGSFAIEWSKNTTTGYYVFGVKFYDGTTTRWVNGTFEITVSLYDDAWVYVYNSQGTGLDLENFIVYINGTRYPDNHFYNRTDYVYNITITDYFDYVVSQDNYTYARFINIGIDFYTFKVYSEVQKEFLYFNLTRTGGARFSQHIGPGEVLSYYLVAGSYDYAFYRTNGPNFDLYSGTFIISGDESFIISDVNLRDLYESSERAATGGGSITIKAILSEQASQRSMLQTIQVGVLGLFFFVFVIQIPEVQEKIPGLNRKKKKGNYPPQLEDYGFGLNDGRVPERTIRPKKTKPRERERR